MIPQKLEISGSHGKLTIEVKSGEILNKSLIDEEYANIVKFDTKEFIDWWKKTLPNKEFPGYGVDILDSGYWYSTRGELAYENPQSDHRDFIYGLLSEDEFFVD